MNKYFKTIKDARGALALNTGFDPFISGNWGRCTKAKLAKAGYVVDAAKTKASDQSVEIVHDLAAARKAEDEFWTRENAPMTNAQQSRNDTMCKAINDSFAPYTVGNVVYSTIEKADAQRARIAAVIAANPSKPAYRAHWALDCQRRAKQEGWVIPA